MTGILPVAAMTIDTSEPQAVGATTESTALTQDVRGVRAGTIVFLGIAAANVGNYLFHFVSARLLGPAAYGDVASLVAVTGLISLPLIGVQLAVTRHVAAFAERGAEESVKLLFTRAFRFAALAALGLTVVVGAVLIPLRSVLGIASLAAVVLAVLVTVPAVVSPVVLGLAQGLQRFGLVSASLALGPTLRPLLAAILLVAGLGVAGALGATLLSTILGTALPLWLLRRWIVRRSSAASPVAPREMAADVVPAILAVLAITSLTTIDVIVAKAALSDHDAGLYGSASLIGRVILYLPAAIVLVLLPKVSARQAAGRESRDVLMKSLLVTAGFCLVGTAAYALAPKLVVFVAFGSSFEGASDFLWMFGLAMSGFALLNVLLAYHLGRGEHRFSALLVGGALLQIVLFGVFHGSPEQLLTVDIAVAFALLIAHQLLYPLAVSFRLR